MPITRQQRFTRPHPCPICGGYDQAARGKATRCYGFLSDNGGVAHCTRGESSGALPQNAASSTFPHRLTGDCACGKRHDPRPAPRASKGEWREPVRTLIYEIRDAAGQVVAEHMRREFADGDKSFTWRRNGKTGLGGLRVKALPLYGLPDLLAAPPGSLVVLTEGEKVRDSLKLRPTLAVATTTGAKTTPGDAALKALVGYSVILWPDNDADGQRHMERIGARLSAMGTTPRVVKWTDAPPKGDAADFPGDGAALAQLLADAVPYQAPPVTNTNGLHPQADTDSEHYTDLGLARRLVALHGGNLRYCWPWKKWLTWTGTRWEPDDTGQVITWTKQTLKEIYLEAQIFYNEATKAAASGDFDPLNPQRDSAKAKADALYAWAVKSEAAARISAAVDLARSEPGVPVLPEAFDADPWTLNCKNGTIDLKTGTLRPHRREDYLSKLAPVDFQPDAALLLWDRFLSEALPDQETRAYVQRCVGATIVGLADDDLLLVCHGEGGTGKSTFLKAVEKMLGDYAASAELATFTSARDAHGPQPDLARLRGRRMIGISEVDAGGALSLLKRATGGDTITTRSHYQESFEFTPQFTLWIITNKRPSIPDDDSGMWRRIREIPFAVKFPKPDPSIRKTLTDPTIAGPGLLAWAVKGCLAWQQEGIGNLPAKVEEATAEYRAEMDLMADFLEDRCLIGEKYWAPGMALWRTYLAWIKDNSIRYPLGRKGFSQRLEKRFSPARGGGRASIRGFAGVGLKTGAQTQSDDWAVTSEVTAISEVSGTFPNEPHMGLLSETKCPQVTAQIHNEATGEVTARSGPRDRQVSAEVTAEALETCRCNPIPGPARLTGVPTCGSCGKGWQCPICLGCRSCRTPDPQFKVGGGDELCQEES